MPTTSAAAVAILTTAAGPATTSRLRARIAAEAVGTAFLVAAIVGSGIAAQRLLPNDPGLVLLVNAVVTGAILTALIATLQPISAAFNPIVTLLDRCLRTITTRATFALIGAQLSGGLAGVVAANLMFDTPAITIATHDRVGTGTLLGEAVAALGLLLVIAVITRTGRTDRLAVAVGTYLTAAIWFTSSTSFANPVVTLVRTLTDTFTGIAPTSAVAFVVAQLAVLAPAYLLIRLLAPDPSGVSSSDR